MTDVDARSVAFYEFNPVDSCSSGVDYCLIMTTAPLNNKTAVAAEKSRRAFMDSRVFVSYRAYFRRIGYARFNLRRFCGNAARKGRQCGVSQGNSNLIPWGLDDGM